MSIERLAAIERALEAMRELQVYALALQLRPCGREAIGEMMHMLRGDLAVLVREKLDHMAAYHARMDGLRPPQRERPDSGSAPVGFHPAPTGTCPGGPLGSCCDTPPLVRTGQGDYRQDWTPHRTGFEVTA